MVNSIQRIRILLSSPGNLKIDRDAVREVADQINGDSGRRDGFHIEVVSWESHTRPSVGTHPQEIINEQFPDDIDIYLGLLGTYFGTPTNKYNSGTEEEFRLAFENWRNSGVPEILFYFSSSKVAPDEINLHQLALCNAFKKEIGDLGVKYDKYGDLMQFKVSLHRHLSEAVYEVLNKGTGSETSFEPQIEFREFLPNYGRLVLENPGIAVGDLFEEATMYLESHTKEMNHLNDDLKRTSFNLNKETKRISNANIQGHHKQALQAGQEISSILIGYRNNFKIRLPTMRSSMEEALVLTQRAINLVRSNELHGEFALKDLMEPMKIMKSALGELRPIVEALNSTFEEWPDIDGEFNNSKYRIIALHRDFCEYVDRSIALITDIEQEIVGTP